MTSHSEETVVTLLLNIVGLRLNDFEREFRDSELLLFFPSFIKVSILSDIFSIFSSLKKTFSTIFVLFQNVRLIKNKDLKLSCYQAT